MPEGSRREEPARSGNKSEFELGFEFLQVVFALGRLAGLHEFAKFAGIFSAEGFLERDGDGFFLGKLRRHPNPRRSLQKCPVPADHQDQRQHHEPFAEAKNHVRSVRSV